MSIFGSHIKPADPHEHSTIASLRNVTKRFAGTIAVNGVSLDVNLGEFVILTGHSGSGKSTVLSMLEGEVKPDEGEVILFGQSLKNLKDKQIEKIKKGHIGIGFQDALLDRSHTVANVIKQTSFANHIRIDNSKVVNLAERFGMLDKLMAETGGLSGGEQMRVAMMRALAPSPDLILLDEPTGAVDTKGKIGALKVLREIMLEEQATVVMVTHDPDIARDFADREYVLESGRLLDVRVYGTFQPPHESSLSFTPTNEPDQLPIVS
jgi:ABC-type lipoprotein export system ATPase subunit